MGDCQFGWLQGVRNLLRQNSFWLQRRDLNQRSVGSESHTSPILVSTWKSIRLRAELPIPSFAAGNPRRRHLELLTAHHTRLLRALISALGFRSAPKGTGRTQKGVGPAVRYLMSPTLDWFRNFDGHFCSMPSIPLSEQIGRSG